MGTTTKPPWADEYQDTANGALALLKNEIGVTLTNPICVPDPHVAGVWLIRGNEMATATGAWVVYVFEGDAEYVVTK